MKRVSAVGGFDDLNLSSELPVAAIFYLRKSPFLAHCHPDKIFRHIVK